MQVEVGWAFTFRASSWGHSWLSTHAARPLSSHMLSGQMEARDPHVSLSMGWDGSYSRGCIFLAWAAVGGSAHRAVAGPRKLGARDVTSFSGCKPPCWSVYVRASRTKAWMVDGFSGLFYFRTCFIYRIVSSLSSNTISFLMYRYRSFLDFLTCRWMLHKSLEAWKHISCGYSGRWCLPRTMSPLLARGTSLLLSRLRVLQSRPISHRGVGDLLY